MVTNPIDYLKQIFRKKNKHLEATLYFEKHKEEIIVVVVPLECMVTILDRIGNLMDQFV